MKWHGVKNQVTRDYKQIKALDRDDAIKRSGWPREQVIWCWELPGQNKKPMPDEVKKYLKNIQEERKKLCAPKKRGRPKKKKED